MPILRSAPFRAIQVLNVPNDEDGHGDCHEKSVENVQEDFVRNEIAGIPLQILHNSKNAAHEYYCARDIEDVQVTPPRDLFGGDDSSRAPDQSGVEEDRGHDKETKDEDLDEKTSDDDLLPYFVHLKASCSLNPATSGLQAESDDIASNEKSRHPLNWDQ